MAKSTRAPTITPAGVLDWTGVRTQRAEYGPAALIFAQGSPATSVMYLEEGAVRLPTPMLQTRRIAMCS